MTKKFCHVTKIFVTCKKFSGHVRKNFHMTQKILLCSKKFSHPCKKFGHRSGNFFWTPDSKKFGPRSKNLDPDSKIGSGPIFSGFDQNFDKSTVFHQNVKKSCFGPISGNSGIWSKNVFFDVFPENAQFGQNLTNRGGQKLGSEIVKKRVFHDIPGLLGSIGEGITTGKACPVDKKVKKTRFFGPHA